MVINLAIQHSTKVLQHVAFALAAIGAVLALIVIIATFWRSRRKK